MFKGIKISKKMNYIKLEDVDSLLKCVSIVCMDWVRHPDLHPSGFCRYVSSR